MGFTPSFSALFSGALVEQCLAILQNNQAAAIAAYPVTPYGALDPIADFHKGPLAAPNFPCCTVVAGDPVFNPESDGYTRDYRIQVTVFLDIRYTDPDQLADWSYNYARLIDQIFYTVTNQGNDLTAFTTAQPITWPASTAPRNTTPLAAGSALEFFVHAHHVGQLAADESLIPGHRIGVLMEFHLEET